MRTRFTDLTIQMTLLSGRECIPACNSGPYDRTDWDVLTNQARILTEAFALIGRPIYINFRWDNRSERHKHLRQLRIPEFLRQVIDEQITALWSLFLSGGRGYRWSREQCRLLVDVTN